MFPDFHGKPINFKRYEQAFPLFPDQLSGTTIDNSTLYDATLHIQKKQSSLRINQISGNIEFQFKSTNQTSQNADTDFCKLGSEGYILIDGSFTYLLISFVKPGFPAYMCGKTNNIFLAEIYAAKIRICIITPYRIYGKLPEKTIEYGQTR